MVVQNYFFLKKNNNKILSINITIV